ncbi:phage protease [Denitratisoma sp. agr-D3]
MSKTRKPTAVAIAALASSLVIQGDAPATEFRLIPAGEFQAVDGRPGNGKKWSLTQWRADLIIAAAHARQSDMVIDYDHQTLHKEKNGQPAPAAGWFKDLEWREDGLWAVNVRWTAEAAADLVSERYRYISPVFLYDQDSGEVLALRMAAITNDPGLDGLTDLSEATLSSLLFDPSQPKEPSMKELLKALGLPETATEAEALTALSALHNAHQGQVAALTAQATAVPDPAKYVAVATLSAAQAELATANAQLAALQAASAAAEVDKVVVAALSAGKLTPATEPWARDLGKTNLAALQAFVEKATPVIVPGAIQTDGNSPAGAATAALSADALKVAGMLGVSAEEYAKTLASESQSK